MTTGTGQDQPAAETAVRPEGWGGAEPAGPGASSAPGARPVESLAKLAEKLEGATDTIARLIATPAGVEPDGEADQCLEALREIGSSLRGAALLIDSMLSHNTAEHREAFKAFVSALGERMREAGTANRGVFERVSEQMAELGGLSEMEPSEALVERLCHVMATVRDVASEVGDHIAAVTADVDRATEQIISLESLLVEADKKAHHDDLTCTGSRLALDIALFKAIGDEQRREPWCFALLDIDHLRDINETLGRAIGDALLYKVARVVETALLRTDLEWTLGRYGGEEFGILLSGSAILSTSKMANSIREKIASSRWSIRRAAEGVLQATVSVGITEHRAGDTMDDVVQRAEKALRKAKSSGRNRVTMEYPAARQANGALRAAMQGRI